ncbi:hypothetical protein Tco_0521779 [Tanacetum coccineum]
MQRCMTGILLLNSIQRKASGTVVNTGARARRPQSCCRFHGQHQSSTSATNNSVNEVHSNDNQIFDNVDYQLNQEMHQEEHLDSDAETEIDDNTSPSSIRYVCKDLTSTQTIPMLSKKPKAATADLHKDLLGTRNPGLGYMAKRAQPALYDADTLLRPTHHPVSIWDSEEVLVHQVVSMKKMNEKPGHVRPANGFYEN